MSNLKAEFLQPPILMIARNAGLFFFKQTLDHQVAPLSSTQASQYKLA